MGEARREYVGAADADFEWIFETPLPPPVLWQYSVDPEKRLRWQTMQTAVENRPNARGRLGVGATSHCAHGSYDLVRHFVDWRPFRYFTWRTEPIKRTFFRPPTIETMELLPRADGGTVYHFRVRLQNRGWLSRLLARLFWPLVLRHLRSIEPNLRRLGEEEELLAQYVTTPDDAGGSS